MDLTIGTFNLNNLFTRWNFQSAETRPQTSGRSAGPTTDTEINLDLEQTVSYRFIPGDRQLSRFRTFKGRLVKAKDDTDVERIAARILTMDVDVLAIQEAENIEALRDFNRDHLGGLYDEIALIEGNDPRLIDVGVLSKLPLRRLVSHQTEPDPAHPNRRVFGRDLLQFDVYSSNSRDRLVTVFNTHLKSNFIPFERNQSQADEDAAEAANNDRRARQAQVMRDVIARETRPNSRYVVLGDMNDDPDSPHMAPLVTDSELGLVDALVDVTETRPPKEEQDDPAWDHARAGVT